MPALVYVAETQTGEQSLWVQPAAGGEARLLWSGRSDWLTCVPSHDGRKLAVAAAVERFSGLERLTIIDVQTGLSSTCVSSASGIYYIRWSPDDGEVTATIGYPITGTASSKSFSIMSYRAADCSSTVLLDPAGRASNALHFPDGKRLLLEDDSGLYIVNTDGSDRKLIPGTVGILLNSAQIDARGNRVKVLKGSPGDAFWRVLDIASGNSADAHRWAGTMGGSAQVLSPDWQYQVSWVLRNGMGTLVLSAFDGRNEKVLWQRDTNAGKVDRAQFSVGGDWVFFGATTDNDAEQWETIFLSIHDDGRRLTVDGMIHDAVQTRDHVFLSLGQWGPIVREKGHAYSEWQSNRLVWVRLASGEVRELALAGTSRNEMSLSPDGKWLAFDGLRGEVQGIFLLNLDSGEISLVVPDGSSPVWVQISTD